jgi:hypothetical protein
MQDFDSKVLDDVLASINTDNSNKVNPLMEDSASYTIQNKLASELSNVLESKTKNLIQLLVKLVDNDIKKSAEEIVSNYDSTDSPIYKVLSSFDKNLFSDDLSEVILFRVADELKRYYEKKCTYINRDYETMRYIKENEKDKGFSSDKAKKYYDNKKADFDSKYSDYNFSTKF